MHVIRFIIFIRIIFIPTATSCTVGCALEGNSEQKITEMLLNNYVTRYTRPVKDASEFITVKFGIQLIQLIDFDDKDKVLTSNIWQIYEWKDYTLTWVPEEYENVESVRLPSDFIWTPDVVLLNHVDTRIEDKREAACKVFWNGTVIWKPMSITKSSCDVDILLFPYDIQHCDLKFASSTYELNRMKLELMPTNPFDLGNYIENHNFKLMTHSSHVQSKQLIDDNHRIVIFKMKIRRFSVSYTYILILPCMLLSVLSSLIYWLPPETPSKPTLGLSLFTSFLLLLLLLFNTMPPTPRGLPLLGIYYCSNMCMIAASSILCAIVVHVYSRGIGSVPEFIQVIFLRYLAPVLLVTTKDVKKLSRNRVSIDDNKWLNNQETYSPAAGENDGALNLKSIREELKAIRDYIRCTRAKTEENERKKIECEKWKQIALTVDRCLFIVYTILSVFLLIALLPS